MNPDLWGNNFQKNQKTFLNSLRESSQHPELKAKSVIAG
jgi:hypothetical protein